MTITSLLPLTQVATHRQLRKSFTGVLVASLLLIVPSGLVLGAESPTVQQPDSKSQSDELKQGLEQDNDKHDGLTDDTSDSAYVEKLVVTAQRREEELQEVPITVTTLDAQELEKAGITNTFELQRRTPALVITHNGIYSEPFIRGIGTDSYAGGGGDPSVAFYTDGVYQPRYFSATVQFFDIERVEVLKGPQGTLYGRNATGGMINVISRPPIPGFDSRLNVEVGNYDRVGLRGFTNIPIKDDRWLFRVSFLRSEADGHVDNLLETEDLGAEDVWATRAQLRFLGPGGRFDFLLGANFTSEGGTRGATYSVDPRYPSPARDVFGGTVPDNPRQVLMDYPMSEDLDQWGIYAKANYHFDTYSVSSLTAYRYAEVIGSYDLDATEINFATNNWNDDSGAFSQDIVFRSRGTEAYDWVAGLSYVHEDAFTSLDVRLPLFDYRGHPRADTSTDAWGLFADGSYELTTRFRGITGFRYSYEKKHHELLDFLNGEQVGEVDESDSWNAFTPRVGLEYRVDQTTMGYLTVARGFKSGGFNAGQLQERSFDPEYVWNYEMGLKTATMQDRLLASLSVFYSDFTDIQVFRQDPTPGSFPEVVNAAAAEIEGAEAEMFWRPKKNLGLRIGVAYLDAALTEFASVDENNPTEDPDQSGNPMTRAPKWSGNMRLDYERPIRNRGTIAAYLGYGFQSEVYFDYFKNPALRQGDYGVLDAELRYTSADRAWYVAAYGFNLTDELYAQSIFSKNELIGTLRVWAPPRMVGLKTGFNF